MESGDDPMNDLSIILDNISKEFNRRPVLKNITLQLNAPTSLAITGKNGSGKSTLSKIIAALLSPTKGKLIYLKDGIELDIENYKHHIGFVAPYLNLYDEFTALENLKILSAIRGNHSLVQKNLEKILFEIELWDRRNDLVGTFSSGMKQKLKFTFALLHQPKVLIIDEPTSNLDYEGVEYIKHIVSEHNKNGISIIATNNKNEANWCNEEICLEP